MTTQEFDANGHPYPAFRMGTVHKKAYTATAGVIDNAVSAKCRLALVWCSTDAHIAIGSAPTATVADRPVTAKVDVLVVLATDDKVSAIQQGVAGDLYVTELL
ncbi:MAG: hypothetical protein V3S12_05880 [Acidiferrobacterales bacterium]